MRLRFGKRMRFLASGRVRHRFERVARFTAQHGGFAFFHGEQELVHLVIQFEQREIRLQTEPQFVRPRVQDVVGRDRGLCLVVKGDDLRPFEAHHVERQFLCAGRSSAAHRGEIVRAGFPDCAG